MCLVGLGVWLNAVFRISSCLALIVVLGPRLLPPVTESVDSDEMHDYEKVSTEEANVYTTYTLIY